MVFRAEWLRALLAGLWVLVLASSLPQLPGLTVLAVKPVIPPFWRILAQLAVIAPCILLILRNSASTIWERVIDVFLCVCVLAFAHFPSPFFDYIWDVCLIETTFVFLASALLRQNPRWFRWQYWPMRLLLFKIMFSMGVIKYYNGMPEWRDGSALQYFWANQPMPGFLSWIAAQLPLTWQKAMSALVFVAEIPGPFLIFLGKRARLTFFLINFLLQAGIFVSGNYGVFNLLTIIISLSLFEPGSPDGEDTVPGKMMPWSKVVTTYSMVALLGWLLTSTWYQIAVFSTHTRQLPETSWVFLENEEQQQLPVSLRRLLQTYAASKTANPYALFGHISKYRMEIELWGSHDSIEWKKYRFRIKPDATDRAPIWYAPHHWRLDHQFYYESFRIRAPETAARYSYFLGSRWMQSLLQALFHNDERVTWLLSQNPFAERPPAYLQMRYTYYAFTDWDTLRKTGKYWRTELPYPGQFYDRVITRSDIAGVP